MHILKTETQQTYYIMTPTEIIRNCAFCNCQFKALRPTATYCSNSCRTKANNQRRENEKIEAGKAAEQAIIDEAKRKAAETRKEKKTQKEANRVNEKRLADIDFEIQAEKAAFESTEKKRVINSIVSTLRVNAEAKDKQIQEADERKKKDKQMKRDKDMKEAVDRADKIGKGLAEFIKDLSKTGKETENASKNPKLFDPPTHPQKQVNFLPPTDPHSNNTELKSIDPQIPDSLNGPFNNKKPGITSPMGPGTPNQGRKVSIIKTIADDILDSLNIF